MEKIFNVIVEKDADVFSNISFEYINLSVRLLHFLVCFLNSLNDISFAWNCISAFLWLLIKLSNSFIFEKRFVPVNGFIFFWLRHLV